MGGRMTPEYALFCAFDKRPWKPYQGEGIGVDRHQDAKHEIRHHEFPAQQDQKDDPKLDHQIC